MPSSNDDALREMRARLAEEDLAARLRFLREIPTLTREEANTRTPIIATGSGRLDAYITHETPSQRVLCILQDGVELFPCFQWHENELVPVVSVVCRMFDSHFSSWQTAFWFVSANGWLRGRTPVDLVLSMPEEVVLAAHYQWVSIVVPEL